MYKAILTGLVAASLLTLAGCGQEVEMPDDTGTGPAETTDTAADTEMEQHTTTGTITAIDHSAARITVDHEPVPTLDWPEMTMQFRVANPELLGRVEPGDEIRFSFVQDSRGAYVIQDITGL